MKLCLIIHSLTSGGAERVLTELANYWDNKKYEVWIITFDNHLTEPFYPLNNNIKRIQLNLSSNKKQKNLFHFIIFNFKTIFCLRKAVKKIKPNLIISFIDLTNIKTLISTRVLNIPVIISERSHPVFNIIPRFYSFLRFLTYPFADRLVVQTNSIASFFPKKLHSILRIIPNKVNSPNSQKVQFSSTIDEIISVGRLGQEKDHITLILAFSRLISIYPNLTLTIYGEGPERNKLELLIETLSLKDRVKLPGKVSNILEKLVKADLFIFPSRFEGFPNALCEAMAVGLPVIASHCSGNIDIIQDKINGRLFPIGDITTLVDLATELLEDKGQREQLSREAKKIILQYSSEVILNQWDCLIHELFTTN